MLSLPLSLAPLLLLLAPHAPAWSLNIERAVVQWVKSSPLLADLHQEHVSASQVRHMMKSTPLVDAPDDAKIDFANGPVGAMVARIMASEQAMLGDWKLEKIVEAAGAEFDEAIWHAKLVEVANRAPVTLFSFVDCPWCLLAKKVLREEYRLEHGDGTLQVIELEDLGRDGKSLRAAIARATGRTSMPACFIDGTSVGGYTDGFALEGNGGNDDGAGFTAREGFAARRIARIGKVTRAWGTIEVTGSKRDTMTQRAESSGKENVGTALGLSSFSCIRGSGSLVDPYALRIAHVCDPRLEYLQRAAQNWTSC